MNAINVNLHFLHKKTNRNKPFLVILIVKVDTQPDQINY